MYTKGPWKLQRSHDNHWRERYYAIWTDEGGKDDRHIATVDGDNAVWLEEGADYSNACLIAAAPELLEACKEFVRKVECGEARSVRSYAQMKAAIAKATGK